MNTNIPVIIATIKPIMYKLLLPVAIFDIAYEVGVDNVNRNMLVNNNIPNTAALNLLSTCSSF